MSNITPKIGSSHWKDENKQTKQIINESISECSDCEFIRKNPSKCNKCSVADLAEKQRLSDLEQSGWDYISHRSYIDMCR